MRRLSSYFGILAFLLCFCAPALKAQDGLPGALSGNGRNVGMSSLLWQELAAADFDNDQKADSAVLLETGQRDGVKAFRIELHVTARRNTTIEFTSPAAELRISAFDVNRDGAPDIVVEKTFTRERVQVYLNDGHGQFRRATERFASPDDSRPQWRAAIGTQHLSLESLGPVRIFELLGGRPTGFPRGPDACRNAFWLDAKLPHCRVRGQSPSRAPPSLPFV